MHEVGQWALCISVSGVEVGTQPCADAWRFSSCLQECFLICTSLSLVLHCSKPPDILHGGHNGLGKAVFPPGTSVNYSCETGFSLVGMASIYCTESGAWSHPFPVCQGVSLLQRAKKKV